MGQYKTHTLPTSAYWVVGIVIITMVMVAFVDIHGIRPFVYACSILYLLFLYWKYSIIKRTFHNKLICLFSLLIVYHTLNCFFQHVQLEYESGYLPFFLGFYANIVVLVIVSALFYQNPNKTLQYLIFFYILFDILAFMSPGLLDSRYESERIHTIYIHPNQFSQCASMGLFVILIYKIIANKSIIWAISMCALPVLSIFLCGSRNGLGQLLFAILTFFIGIMYQKKNTSIKIIFSLVVVGLISFYIINNSYMGERLLQSNEITYHFDYVKTGTPLDWLGDRQIYYLLGFQNFVENPIFGIGLRAFGTYNVGFGYPLHSEYMIHLTEGGLIGIIIYALFLYLLGKKLLQVYRQNKDAVSITMLLTFICYLMIGLVARECYYAFFFPVLGILISFTEREKTD